MTEEVKEELKQFKLTPRMLAYDLLFIGLLLIVFTFGCDKINQNAVEKSQGAFTLAQSEFEAKYKLQEMEINAKFQFDDEPDFKPDSEEYKKWQNEQNEIAKAKNKALDELKKEQLDERKAKEKSWYKIAQNARNASNNYNNKKYFLSWLFLIGVIVLVFAIVFIAYVGDKTEKLIMLILLAAIAFTFLGGKVPLL